MIYQEEQYGHSTDRSKLFQVSRPGEEITHILVDEIIHINKVRRYKHICCDMSASVCLINSISVKLAGLCHDIH